MLLLQIILCQETVPRVYQHSTSGEYSLKEYGPALFDDDFLMYVARAEARKHHDRHDDDE
jgi:hypothetical protein